MSFVPLEDYEIKELEECRDEYWGDFRDDVNRLIAEVRAARKMRETMVEISNIQRMPQGHSDASVIGWIRDVAYKSSTSYPAPQKEKE